MWEKIHAAENAVFDLVPLSPETKESRRLEGHILRELLLLESSDWPFLVTTAAARDYAQKRFEEHAACLDNLLDAARNLSQGIEPGPAALQAVAWARDKDRLFADIVLEADAIK